MVATYLTAGTPTLPPWDQHSCDSLLTIHVLCRARAGWGLHFRSCDGGVCIDLVYTAGKKRYVFVADPMGAHDAEAYCAARGGTLVVLESRDEREQLWHEARPARSRLPVKVWIGLATDDAGTWTLGRRHPGRRVVPASLGVRQPLCPREGRRSLQYDPNGTIDDTLAMTAPDAGTALPCKCQIRTAKARIDGGGLGPVERIS